MVLRLKHRISIAALPALMGLAALSACVPAPAPKSAPPVAVEEVTKAKAWQGIASLADKSRIDRSSIAWAQGLAEAKRAHAKEVADEGDLLKPNAALPRPAPTPGSYRCRLVTLGRDSKKGPTFERFKPFFCYIGLEGDLFTIVKQTGSQRPAGRLWEDDSPNRLVFLGTLALGNEEEARAYGDDPKRDMAGLFERIAPFRWRLVIPFPQDGSKLEVFELTPVADQPAP
ncbi:DUF4893 domain-containing protein [Sphingomonas rhizophila]|uniref:DUF4893 domain-containing protein n=1 Tax=Sphingomonas rhizophila TaxID=2071607 RepID=A0A7G9SBE9_9SPHN|nr:DUF4893 domain-containing protein [Sphingomonas rhizophila]QNN65174.1 DUF4893 domain-containing protein [Sphingomonas rhizophila]